MRVVEIFVSKQGEGLWAGVESVFIRTLGCHLRCGFCDTEYASWESGNGLELSVEEIVGRIIIHRKRHVVLTGGEPMLHAEMVPLSKMLEREGLKITIETSGTLELPVRAHLMSISPKLSNSIPFAAGEDVIRRHEYNRAKPEIVRQMIKKYDYQLKFVIDRPQDFLEMEKYLEELPGAKPTRILLMPQARTPEEMREKETWIREYAQQKGYRYAPRMQLEWYGNRRGT